MPLLVVSHRQQAQQADCLAACAAMVLDYLQIRVDYRRLTRLLRIQPHGAAFANLRYLITLGLHVDMGRGDLAILRATIEAGSPVIAALDTAYLAYWAEKTDHAVVVAGMDATSVVLHDPDLPSGPRWVPIAQFESAWLEHDYLFAVVRS